MAQSGSIFLHVGCVLQGNAKAALALYTQGSRYLFEGSFKTRTPQGNPDSTTEEYVSAALASCCCCSVHGHGCLQKAARERVHLADVVLLHKLSIVHAGS